jgi:hypothetical protein
MRKELANLIPTYNMAFYHVKIGFRILTKSLRKQPNNAKTIEAT